MTTALPTRSGVRAVINAADAITATAETAALVPPITTSAHCVCGSVFEIRRVELDLTDDELDAATAAVSEVLGGLATGAEIVCAVVDAVNKNRYHADCQALDDWRTYHEPCRGDW